MTFDIYPILQPIHDNTNSFSLLEEGNYYRLQPDKEKIVQFMLRIEEESQAEEIIVVVIMGGTNFRFAFISLETLKLSLSSIPMIKLLFQAMTNKISQFNTNFQQI